MFDNGIATDSMQTVFCFRESINEYLHSTTFPHLQSTFYKEDCALFGYFSSSFLVTSCVSFSFLTRIGHSV